MKKLTKTALTTAAMATMVLGTLTSLSADEKKNGWVGSGTNYEYYVNGTKKLNTWVQAGEDWYFLDSDGKMATNSFIRSDAYTSKSEVLDKDDVNDLWTSDDFDDDSTFYFVDSQGKMVSGWLAIDSSSIYLSPNSSKKDKIWYYFSTEGPTKGAMYTNAWIKSGEDWYAVGEDGQMYTNAKLPNDLAGETDIYEAEDEEDVYYVDSNGKMVTGWYKTVKADTDENIKAYLGEDERDTFSDDGLWIYADPNTGALAWNEWVQIEDKWYYIGVGVHDDGHEDDKLDVVVYENELSDQEVLPTNKGEYELKNMTLSTDEHEDDLDYNQHLDNRFVMLEDKIIYWTNHNADDDKYFYLQEGSGAMLADKWYEFEDDYYIWANSKGELATDTVESVNGRYYYFNKAGICNYKDLNNIADYVIKYKYIRNSGEKAQTGYLFFNTDTNSKDLLPGLSNSELERIKADDVTQVYQNVKVSDLKKDNDLLKEDVYRFGQRKVQKKSMTDLEAILAKASECLSWNGEDRTNTLDEDMTIYKLRNSTKMAAKVSITDDIAPVEFANLEVSAWLQVKNPKTYRGVASGASLDVNGTGTSQYITQSGTYDSDKKITYKVAAVGEKVDGSPLKINDTYTANDGTIYDIIGAELNLTFEDNVDVRLDKVPNNAKVYTDKDDTDTIIKTERFLPSDNDQSYTIWVDKPGKYEFSVVTSASSEKNSVIKTIIIDLPGAEN